MLLLVSNKSNLASSGLLLATTGPRTRLSTHARAVTTTHRSLLLCLSFLFNTIQNWIRNNLCAASSRGIATGVFFWERKRDGKHPSFSPWTDSDQSCFLSLFHVFGDWKIAYFIELCSTHALTKWPVSVLTHHHHHHLYTHYRKIPQPNHITSTIIKNTIHPSSVLLSRGRWFASRLPPVCFGKRMISKTCPLVVLLLCLLKLAVRRCKSLLLASSWLMLSTFLHLFPGARKVKSAGRLWTGRDAVILYFCFLIIWSPNSPFFSLVCSAALSFLEIPTPFALKGEWGRKGKRSKVDEAFIFFLFFSSCWLSLQSDWWQAWKERR